MPAAAHVLRASRLLASAVAAVLVTAGGCAVTGDESVAALGPAGGPFPRASGADEPVPAAEADEVARANRDCLDCHDGTPRPASRSAFDGLDPTDTGAALEASVHAGRLMCTDCHRRAGDPAHADANRSSAPSPGPRGSATCRRCHFASYVGLIEGVHGQVPAAAASRAPGCVDCHGAHDTTPVDRARATISRRCERCHAEVYAAWARSVHGRGLATGDALDVPVCTDCHRAHDTVDPHERDFHLAVPALCGRCHGDASRMRRYHLSSDVVRSYLADFHGVGARAPRGPRERGPMGAVCTDCHGVHDIASTRAVAIGVLKSRLALSCERCHRGDAPRLPDAWLLHYEATLTRAPLVFLVRGAYRVMTPLLLGGLLLQILLHLWRIAVNRW